MVYAASVKQRLNTTSTTDSELVGVSNAMPRMIWTRYFMEAYGYNVQDVYIYRDNQSTILLETNGMKSVGKISRHIRIKYFFITKRVKEKEMKVIYYPTKEMVAAFFTKPLKGVLFIVHRNTILGGTQNDMALYRHHYNEYIAKSNDADTA